MFLIIVWIALAQVVAGVLVLRPGRGSAWVLALNVLTAVKGPALARRRRPT